MSTAMKNTRDIVTRAPLLSYYVITFVLSWLLWAPGLWMHFSQDAPLHSPKTMPFVVLGSFGPTITTLLLSGLLGGKPEIIRMCRKLIQWRVNWKWYLIAIFCFTVINFPLSLIAWPFLEGVTIDVYIGALVSALVSTVVIIPIKVPTGPLGEELGWRGFAVPRLQHKLQNATLASIIQGVLWSFWHFPIMFFPEWRSQLPILTYLGLYTLIIVPFCIIITWLLNNTRGSVLHAILIHAAFNGSMAMLLGLLEVDQQLGLVTLFLLLIGGLWAASAILIAVFGPKHLTRKPDFTFEEVL